MIKKILFSYFMVNYVLYASDFGSQSPDLIVHNFSDSDMQVLENLKNNILIQNNIYPYLLHKKYGTQNLSPLKNQIQFPSIENELEDISLLIESEQQQNKNKVNLTLDQNMQVDSHFEDDDLEYYDISESMQFDDDQDDLKYFDALDDLVPHMTAGDLIAQDEYSGYDKHFDFLYRLAKRDIYLFQQQEIMYPNQKYSFNTLKKYYIKLGEQRQQMARLKKIMGKEIGILFDDRQYSKLNLEPRIRKLLKEIDHYYFNIYSKNVILPKNLKSLIDYQIPLLQGVSTKHQPQIKLNNLNLLKAYIIVDQLQKFQNQTEIIDKTLSEKTLTS